MKYEIPKPRPNPTKFPIQPIYGLTAEQARAMHTRMRWELYDAEYYMFVFQPADRKIIERCIPAPLELVPRSPLVSIFVQQLTINEGKGNDSLNYGYLEQILSAFATYKGKLGMYPLAIFIETDIGAMLGREMFGTAKKCAQFEYKKSGNHFSWKIMRRNILLAEAEGDILDNEVESDNVTKFVEQPTYHLHQTIAPMHTRMHYACAPRLMEMQVAIKKVYKLRTCDNVKMVFHESPFDPICLFQPKEIQAVSYMNADTAIVLVNDLEKLDPDAMVPFLFSKFDPF